MNKDNIALNNITNEKINEKGEHGVDIFCEECSYKTGFMTFKSAVFKINMQVILCMMVRGNYQADALVVGLID